MTGGGGLGASRLAWLQEWLRAAMYAANNQDFYTAVNHLKCIASYNQIDIPQTPPQTGNYTNDYNAMRDYYYKMAPYLSGEVGKLHEDIQQRYASPISVKRKDPNKRKPLQFGTNKDPFGDK